MSRRVDEVIEEVVSEHALPDLRQVRTWRWREQLCQLRRRSMAGSAAQLLEESEAMGDLSVLDRERREGESGE